MAAQSFSHAECNFRRNSVLHSGTGRSPTCRSGKCGTPQQLAVFKRDNKRPSLNRRDDCFWIGLRAIWKNWKSALIIVRPETVISWQRKRFKRYWWRLSQPNGPGRPPMCAEIRKLVRSLASANLLWGAPRIHGELLKLGFEISERSVSRLMPKRHIEPSQS